MSVAFSKFVVILSLWRITVLRRSTTCTGSQASWRGVFTTASLQLNTEVRAAPSWMGCWCQTPSGLLHIIEWKMVLDSQRMWQHSVTEVERLEHEQDKDYRSSTEYSAFSTISLPRLSRYSTVVWWRSYIGYIPCRNKSNNPPQPAVFSEECALGTLLIWSAETCQQLGDVVTWWLIKVVSVMEGHMLHLSKKLSNSSVNLPL